MGSKKLKAMESLSGILVGFGKMTEAIAIPKRGKKRKSMARAISRAAREMKSAGRSIPDLIAGFNAVAMSEKELAAIPAKMKTLTTALSKAPRTMTDIGNKAKKLATELEATKTAAVKMAPKLKFLVGKDGLLHKNGKLTIVRPKEIVHIDFKVTMDSKDIKTGLIGHSKNFLTDSSGTP
jgi:hypothetical protein